MEAMGRGSVTAALPPLKATELDNILSSPVRVVLAGAPPIDMYEVFAAVETLYEDELKPCGRILRKRLSERAADAGHGSVDVCIKRLRPVCEACPWLCVQVEEGGDWSALIRGRPAEFVDVYCPRDIYPPAMWQEAEYYFQSLDDSRMVLPGGRYSCAQALMQRKLPFLKSRSLGQVCHIVQLAISQKKILGYLNGAVVPYCRSQSMVKERCAEKQRPCSSALRGTNMLATWDVLRSCLKEILTNVSLSSGSIPLSNVKRIFRSRFHVELSETALGHAKLSELLQDERLRDVCTVKLRCHGYVVVPCEPQDLQEPQQQLQPLQQPQRSQPQIQQLFPSQEAYHMPLSASVPAGGARPGPERHSADAKASPSAPRASALPTSKPGGSDRLRERATRRGVKPMDLDDVAVPSAPAWVLPPISAGTPGSASMRRCRSVPPCATPLGNSGGIVLPATPPAPGLGFRPVLTPSTLGSYGYGIQNTFIHAAVPLPTPLARAQHCRSRSLPRNMYSELLNSPANSSPESSRYNFGPRSPLRCVAGAEGGPVLLGRWFTKEQDGNLIKKGAGVDRPAGEGLLLTPCAPPETGLDDDATAAQHIVRLADFI